MLEGQFAIVDLAEDLGLHSLGHQDRRHQTEVCKYIAAQCINLDQAS